MRSGRACSQSKRSRAAVKLAGAAVLAALALPPLLTGCGGLPRVVRGDTEIPEDGSLVLLAVKVAGDQVPVQAVFDGGDFLGLGLFAKTIVFAPPQEDGRGDATLDELAAVALAPEPVTAAIAWVGEYYEFAGGRLEAALCPEPGMVYYLGTVVIQYGEGPSVDVYAPPEDGDRTGVGGLPRAAADMPASRTRYLTATMRIVDDESAARGEAERRFARGSDRFVNATTSWRRVAGGGLLGSSKEWPVPVTRQQ